MSIYPARWLTFGLLISFLTLHAQLPPGYEWDLEEIICKEQENAEFNISQRYQRTAFADQTDVVYQVMHWEIDPSQLYIQGEITYHFKSNIAGLSSFHLDLTKALQVESVTSGETPLTFVHSDDQLLTIALDKTIGIGEHDTITVRYQGTPPESGFGSFKQGDHAGHPIVWTLSEPYGVKDWWPGKQDLVDKIDSIDIYITTPSGQLAASNGKLVSITASDDKLIHHWRHRYPITSYLIALAVTNYTAYSQYLPLDNGDTIEILNYVYPESFAQAQIATEESLKLMALYNELFGTYPFANEKYGHAQFGWSGGMEHQTMSFMRNFSFDLQAHEMAHQWFGDKVTCGSWTEIWLNEGFATYLTGLAYERFSPDLYWNNWKISTSNNATSQPGGSVFVDDTTSVNRIFSSRLTYNKGAYLLHMLRWITGDPAFFAACRDYLDLPGTAFDFGSTEELQAYLEQRSGKDLDGFFADWYYGQGFPSYQLKWSQQSDSLIIWLGQTTSHPSVDFFEMPVPVSVTISGVPVTFVLDHQYRDQRFSLYIGEGHIDSMAIDPERWLLSRDNSVTEMTTSLYPSASDDKFLIYPNPSDNDFNILPADEVKSVTLINGTGEQWNEAILSGKVNVAQLPSGFYILTLYNSQSEILAVKPVVIHH